MVSHNFILLPLLVVLMMVSACRKQADSSVEQSQALATANYELPKPIQVTPEIFFSKARASSTVSAWLEATPLPKVNFLSDGSTLPDQSAAGVGLFTTFDSDDGLALDALGYGKSLLCDSRGHLWMGTQGGGVSRFDGKSFTTFTTTIGLANNLVLCLAEDAEGNIWIGTGGGGVSCYNGHSFRSFTTEDGLAGNDVMCIEPDRQGNLWMGTYNNGISRFDGKKFTNYSSTPNGLAGNSVRSLAFDKQGYLWCGTEGAGLSRFNGTSFRTFTTLDGLADNRVLSLTTDLSGNLWAGTKGGVTRIKGQSIQTWTTQNGLPFAEIWSIAADRNGNVWMGTGGGGVSRWNGQWFTNFNTNQGLASGAIVSISEDKVGNIWFGTEGGGVSLYRGGAFITLTSNQGLPDNTVLCMAESRNGTLWLGTQDSGVVKFDGRTFHSLRTKDGIPHKSIGCLATDSSGNTWIGSESGVLSRFDGTKLIRYTRQHGLSGNPIRSLFLDAKGVIWIGTDGGGLTRFDGKLFSTYTTRQGLPHDAIWSIEEDAMGNLWLGTNGCGVIRYDGQHFLNFTTKQGLISNFIKSIHSDSKGNLWVGTGGGLSILPAESVLGLSNQVSVQHPRENKAFFVNYTKNQGLPDQFIASVKEDHDGNMLLGTNFGIWVIPKKQAQKMVHQNKEQLTGNLEGLVIFNQFTGYPVRDVNAGYNNGAVWVDRSGMIWIGHGSNGITRIDLKTVRPSVKAPQVVIQALKINNDQTCWYSLGGLQTDSLTLAQQSIITYGRSLERPLQDSLKRLFTGIQFDSITRFYPLPTRLVLPYQHNNVSFDYVAIETGRNRMVRYQYMLEGYDRGWSPVTETGTATFGNIHEGFYRFKVKARSPEGIWSEPVTFSFQVLPPWWRSWWAFTLYALFFLFLLRLFIQWRERNLRLDKEKLEQTVLARTAEVVAEKKKSDDLLLNILPEEVAEELKQTGKAQARQYNEVTVLFTDFVGFTGIASQMAPRELVEEIHRSFSAFDSIIEQFGLEKIKTIGDAYMAVGGLPIEHPEHAVNTVKAALAIRDYIAKNESKFQVRIGVHTGSVVAGIVGVKKYAYDIWGDTVNTASRLESSGSAGKVNISETTFVRVKLQFQCEYRGTFPVKGKGEVRMYFAENLSVLSN